MSTQTNIDLTLNFTVTQNGPTSWWTPSLPSDQIDLPASYGSVTISIVLNEILSPWLNVAILPKNPIVFDGGQPSSITPKQIISDGQTVFFFDANNAPGQYSFTVSVEYFANIWSQGRQYTTPDPVIVNEAPSFYPPKPPESLAP